jgi:Rhodopirellula transposase DDE domain
VKTYDPEIEGEMRAFYESLNEKDRRRYAAIEARKLGHGGASYIAAVVGCERRLIATGLAELQDQAALARTRIRQAGAGRKPATETLPQLEETFLAVLAEHTAGSPVDEQVKWTNLTREQIADQLKERECGVSESVVKQLLERHGFVRRKAQKKQAMGKNDARNEQFEEITQHKEEYLNSANPVLSMDTKKKN